MRLSYKTKRGELIGEGDASLFLADGNGGYFTLGSPSNSHYQGWFTFLNSEWELYKIIEDISPIGIPNKIINMGDVMQRHIVSSREKFWVHKNALIYTISNYQGPIDVTLDFRRVHDFDDKGRIYEIKKDKGVTVIHYKKYYDNSLQNLKEEFFLAVKGNVEFVPQNKWIERNYSYDKSRDVKSNFYVYNAFKMYVYSEKNNLIIFGFGKTQEEAISNCKKEYRKHKFFLGKNAFGKKSYKSKEDIAKKALDNLIIKPNQDMGIFAGLPWFYQFWSRDELISLGGLISQKRYKESVKIIMRQFEVMNDKGIIGNRWPKSELSSADGTGWFYKRIYDLFKLKAFNNKQLKTIYDALKKTISSTRENLLYKGLIRNGPLETWMDTTPKNKPEISDDRRGYRVEIQALHTRMYKLAGKIGKFIGETDYVKYLKYEVELYGEVRKHMLKNKILHDGLNEDFSIDKTVRPNVFLAYYIYPKMIKSDEWEKTFDNVLYHCWFDWGGLSSISKKNNLFCKEHTGINNDSYHRGDSWFFLNNIAAISMHKLNSEKYINEIEQIEKASVNEMLFRGFSGQCAEISDATKLNSKGCFAQGWSAATLIELTQTTGFKK